jgi:tetratricopeptide (TPR) repeat protein
LGARRRLRQARSCYLAAARNATRQYAHGDAERLYRDYLRLVSEPTGESIQARNDLVLQVLQVQGRSREGLQEQMLAVKEARQLGDRSAEVQSIRFLGAMCKDLGRVEEARDCYEQALAAAREVGDRTMETRSLRFLADLHQEQGRTDEAISTYLEVIRLQRQMGTRTAEAITLSNLAILYADCGRMEEASELFDKALEMQSEPMELRHRGITLGNSAVIPLTQRRYPEARRIFEQALAVHRQVGNRLFEGVLLANLADVDLAEGRPEEARALLEQALFIHRQVGNRFCEGISLLSKTRRERRAGTLEEAARCVAQAQSIFAELNAARCQAMCLVEQGHLALASDGLAEGRFTQAQSLLEQANGLAAEVHCGQASLLGQSVLALGHAVEAGRQGATLFRGECVDRLPDGLRRWLTETGQINEKERKTGERRERPRAARTVRRINRRGGVDERAIRRRRSEPLRPRVMRGSS